MEKWNILSKKRENGIGGLFVAEKKAFSFLSKTNNGKGLWKLFKFLFSLSLQYIYNAGEKNTPQQ